MNIIMLKNSNFKINLIEAIMVEDFELLEDAREKALKTYNLKDPVDKFEMWEKIEEIKKDYGEGVILQFVFDNKNEIWSVFNVNGSLLTEFENVFSQDDKININKTRRAIY